MPQAFLARKYFVPGEPPREEVYKPAPYYYGVLSSDDAAEQIAEESSLTKGDVLNVVFPTAIGACEVVPMPLEEFRAMFA